MKRNKTDKLPVMEHFYTLQGEGYHSGTAAYFIRLAGCDVGCVWCDVKESWEVSNNQWHSINQIVDWVIKAGAKRIVVTGGEPAMYNLNALTKAFQKQNILCHIETSGAYELTGHWDWVCLSPKKFKPPLEAVLQKADELKAIVFNHSDFEWAEKYAALVGTNCKLFLNPEWDKKEQVLSLMIDYVLKHPKWRIGIQMHKYIGVP